MTANGLLHNHLLNEFLFCMLNGKRRRERSGRRGEGGSAAMKLPIPFIHCDLNKDGEGKMSTFFQWAARLPAEMEFVPVKEANTAERNLSSAAHFRTLQLGSLNCSRIFFQCTYVLSVFAHLTNDLLYFDLLFGHTQGVTQAGC